MGDLTQLSKGILEEARAHAMQIQGEAEERARLIVSEAKSAASARKSELLSQAEREAANAKRRIETSAELDDKRASLEARDQIIEETFRLAMQKVHQLPLDRKAGLFVRLLIESAETGTEEVQAAGPDRDLVRSLLPQVNLELQKNGKAGQLRLGPEASEITGGFIVIGDRYRVDNSLESLVTGIRDDVVPGVAGILFE